MHNWVIDPYPKDECKLMEKIKSWNLKRRKKKRRKMKEIEVDDYTHVMEAHIIPLIDIIQQRVACPNFH